MATTVDDSATVSGATSAPKRSAWIDLAQLVVLVVGLFYLTIVGANSLDHVWQWYRIPDLIYEVVDGGFVQGPLIDGLLVTFDITALSLPLAVIIGLTTALLRRSKSIAGRALATGYLEVIRNTPILVQVYIFYFVLAPIFGLGGFWACVLALSFHEGSFIAEIFRAGIESVHKGQWEASDSIGMKRADTYRYVVLPQAIPLMLPPLTSQFVTLIKHSSILSAVAVFDLSTIAMDLAAETFMVFEIWLTAGAIYLVVTVALSVLVSLLEGHIRKRWQR